MTNVSFCSGFSWLAGKLDSIVAQCRSLNYSIRQVYQTISSWITRKIVPSQISLTCHIPLLFAFHSNGTRYYILTIDFKLVMLTALSRAAQVANSICQLASYEIKRVAWFQS